MEKPEQDPFAYLMSFDDPGDRAYVARISGMIDQMDERSCPLWSGGGVEAAINDAIIQRGQVSARKW